MNSSSDHFFITGASGFFGGVLLQKLLADDPSLRLTLLEHRRKIIVEERYRDRVTTLVGGLEARYALDGVDTVIHLAATTHAKDRDLYRVTNTEGTKKLLGLAKDSGVKHFIYVSTTALGDSCGAYGASKLDAEKAVRQSGIPYTIVRLSEVYGGESHEGIERLIGVTRSFSVIPYVMNTFLAPVYVDDALAALSSAIHHSPENKTYVIAGPERLSFSQVIENIALAFGKKVLCVPIPQVFLRITGRMLSFLSAPDQVERLICEKDYDSHLAVQDLGFLPRSFREGLQRGYVKN